MRFFIEISYRGTNYHGWQVQPKTRTVQQEINVALSTILGQKINVTGAGRTDAGVHARQMYAHFDFDKEFNINEVIFRLNQYLPKDITIHNIFQVDDNINARFDAINRTYYYYIIHHKDAFIEDAYLIHKELDVSAMNVACKYLLGKQDFTSFTKINNQAFTNLCNVTHAEWFVEEKKLIFIIRADRFLWNMVRTIVGTLVQIGQNKMEACQLREIIEKKDRSLAGNTVPAKGLFLDKIEYPKELLNA